MQQAVDMLCRHPLQRHSHTGRERSKRLEHARATGAPGDEFKRLSATAMEAKARRHRCKDRRWRATVGRVCFLPAGLGEFALCCSLSGSIDLVACIDQGDGAACCWPAGDLSAAAFQALPGRQLAVGFLPCPLTLSTQLASLPIHFSRLTAAAQAIATRQRPSSSISLVTLVSCNLFRACFSSAHLSARSFRHLSASHFQPPPFSTNLRFPFALSRHVRH